MDDTVIYRIQRSTDGKFARPRNFWRKVQWGIGQVYLSRKKAEKGLEMVKSIQDYWPTKEGFKAEDYDWGEITLQKFRLVPVDEESS